MKRVFPYHNTPTSLLTLELSVGDSIRRRRTFYRVIDTPKYFAYESSVTLRSILRRFHRQFFHNVAERDGGPEELLDAECHGIVTAQQPGGTLFENAVHEECIEQVLVKTESHSSATKAVHVTFLEPTFDFKPVVVVVVSDSPL